MAILQMKKLRLLAVRDQKEELLKELIRHGCVEFSELQGELQGTELEGLLHPENSEAAALRARHQTLVHAIELLDHYAPKKSKLLSAKPELEPRVLLDDTGLTGALKTAEAIFRRVEDRRGDRGLRRAHQAHRRRGEPGAQHDRIPPPLAGAGSPPEL